MSAGKDCGNSTTLNSVHREVSDNSISCIDEKKPQFCGGNEVEAVSDSGINQANVGEHQETKVPIASKGIAINLEGKKDKNVSIMCIHKPVPTCTVNWKIIVWNIS